AAALDPAYTRMTDRTNPNQAPDRRIALRREAHATARESRRSEWSRRPDSNRRRADYESAALPAELRRPGSGRCGGPSLPSEPSRCHASVGCFGGAAVFLKPGKARRKRSRRLANGGGRAPGGETGPERGVRGGPG